jgi:ATP-dependent Lhr-like helicase
LLETRGTVRRGYFVDGLPGLQFALPDVVEALRSAHGDATRAKGAGPEVQRVDRAAGSIAVLCAADPAQLFGSDDFGGPLRFSRVASSAVATYAGDPVAVFEDSGASASAVDEHPAIVPCLAELGRWWAGRREGRLRVERWNGASVLESGGALLLEDAGFIREYGGMTWIRPV